jgi:hypothetical protein
MDDLDFDELSEEETHEAREAYWNVRVPGHHSVPSVTTVNIDVRSYENDTHSKALLSIENVTSIQLELRFVAARSREPRKAGKSGSERCLRRCPF